ncbi:MAG: XdhC family protein [Lachnospiraceae bacterium]
MDIYEEILKARRSGTPYSVATIVKTVGCTPRSAGTKMLVFGDGSCIGTIGGSQAEVQAVKDCLDAIRSGRPALKTYSPETLGQTDCQKTIEVFIEPGDTLPHLYLIGAGHVAQSVLPYAKKLGFYNIVIDTRDTSEYAEFLSDSDEIIKVDTFSQLETMDFAPRSFIIICTYSHATDGEATLAVMDKNAAYIGMLGAKHKFLPIFDNLKKHGYSEEVIKGIYAPIGLDIGGETPEEIGMSIMAEILAVKNGCSAAHLRDKKRAHIFGDS